MTQAQKMNKALEREVISKLKADGFEGKFPHYRRFFPDRIELISFPKAKYGNGFHVIASIAYPNREKWEQNIAYPFFTGELDELTADDCGKRYALKSRFGRVFYYTDVYAIAFFGGVIYESVSENRMKDYHLRCLDIHVQKSDEGIYQRICDEINRKMPKIYRWWRKMSK